MTSKSTTLLLYTAGQELDSGGVWRNRVSTHTHTLRRESRGQLLAFLVGGALVLLAPWREATLM